VQFPLPSANEAAGPAPLGGFFSRSRPRTRSEDSIGRQGEARYCRIQLLRA